jgi:hypothetical protein
LDKAFVLSSCAIGVDLRTKAAIFILIQLFLSITAEAKQVILQHSLRTFTIYDKDGNHWQIIDPPKHWFQMPAPKNITISIVSEDEMRRNCKGFNETRGGTIKKIVGCAVKQKKKSEYCNIFVDENLTVQSRNIVIYHEEAHCHGWPQYHPTGEALPFPRPNPMGAVRKQEGQTQ